MARRRRSTGYHESGHAIGHHYYRLAGKTSSVTMDADDLAKYNETKHDVNAAARVLFRGRMIGPIVGHSIDLEQIHHILITLLAGPAAGWIYGGESQREAKPDPQTEEEARQHGDGTDDFSRVWKLLLDTNPLHTEEVLKRIPEDKRGPALTEEVWRSEAHRAFESHEAQLLEKFEALWREAAALVAEKWPQVQAVADALWRKRRLSGEEVTAIIERVKERTQSLPPIVERFLNSNPAPTKPEEE